MSKKGLILTSLIGAVPGALMAALMVMAFINHAGGPTVLHKILSVLALLIGLLLAAMPIGILVLTGPKAEKQAAKKKDEAAEESGELVEATEGEIGDSSDLLDEGAAVTDENLVVDEGPPDEFAVTGEVVADDLEAESDDFAVEEEVEEEAPKKKKK